jgi:hypothetical protein
MQIVAHLASSPIPWVLDLELLELPHSALIPTVVTYAQPGHWTVIRGPQVLTSQ